MAALIVGITVLAVLMTVAMPVWKQAVQREKEAELVFRGEQYARAVGLFQRKFANAYPPTIDTLVEQKFLRKKYKDPITDDDFEPLRQGQAAPQGGAQGAPGRGGQPQGQPPGAPAPGRGGIAAITPGTVAQGSAPAGGIIGVASKSKDVSIRLYKGRSHYNEWAFVYTPPPGAAGGAPGAPGAGGRGPGQRGNPPGTNPPGTNPQFPGGLPGRGRGAPPPGGPNGPGGRGAPFNPFNSGQSPFPTTPPGRGR